MTTHESWYEKAHNIKELFDKYKNDPTLEKIVKARNFHICKYCGNITREQFEDLLCDECVETFGHRLYSDL